MRRWHPLIAATVAALALAGTARAQDNLEEEEVPEVEDLDVEAASLDDLQNRKYVLLHEISLLGGGLPVDPYYKGITGTLGYTLHFSDALAWEVVQFTYSFNVDTKLKKNLVNTSLALGNVPPEFPEIEWIAASHLVLKPLYGKQALFNTEVMHLEVYLQAGPAFLRRGQAAESLAFGFDAGFGIRVWATKWISIRADVMELVYFLEAKPEQTLRLHLGAAFNLRGED